MSTFPTRRDLLRATSGLGALALSATAAQGASPSPVPSPSRNDSAGELGEGELFQISLAQWSNHKSLQAGEQTHLEWITNARAKYGISAVEFVNSFFKDKACNWSYLAEMKTVAASSGVALLLIMIDGEGSLAAEDAKERAQAIENHRKWMVAASYLGCHSIRVNAAGSGDVKEMQKRAADSLVQLANFGAPYRVNVIVENHGGHSSNGEWLAGVMKLASDERVGTLPDFGNFRIQGDEWYDRYKGVEELMPYAKAVSAKSHDFDENGDETHTDYRRMLSIVTKAGYKGHVGIEYEGSTLSEDEGILKTRELLLRVRAELS